MRKLIAILLLSSTPAAAQVAVPTAITADGVPPIPTTLADEARPYGEGRAASPIDWGPVSKSLLISTRFANVAQLHSVAGPMMMRSQVTFETDRVGDARYSPSGDVLVVQKDVGGGEFYQLYTLKAGRLILLTDGKSRNGFGAFSKDGKLIGYT